jgi:hypothetical protein
MTTALFCFSYFSNRVFLYAWILLFVCPHVAGVTAFSVEMGACKLFAWGGLELQFSGLLKS